MKQQVIYCCEFCSGAYEKQADCEEHEATHFGLTRKEYLDWRILHKDAAQAGRMFGCCHDAKTSKSFDDCVERLTAFEVGHGLESVQKKPSDFYY